MPQSEIAGEFPVLTAIVREVSPSIEACELSFVARSSIDVGRAREQHRQYQKALHSLGCDVIVLPAQADLPDAVFVEDVALVLDEVAVITRPATASRQPEVASVATVLERYRRCVYIHAPGTLEGGDVLRIGRTIYVGLSARSNQAGVEQLRVVLSGYGYTVVPMATSGCLHLKSAVTMVADGTLLIQSDWVARENFSGFKLIDIDPDEPHAANALRVADGLIYPSCFPRTQARLAQHGIKVTAVDVSELQKAEGAVTCCSLVFEDGTPSH